MSLTRTIVLLLTGTALCGCATTIDTDAERNALLKTDQQWASLASQGADIETLVAFWSDDAKVFPVNGPVVDGKAAIRAYVTESLKIPGFRITWHPSTVVVSRSGDLGYTTGENSVSLAGPDGKMATFPGRYVTVWRKQGGQWKCVIDIWNSGPTQ